MGEAATLLKLTLFHGCFSRFFYCTNGTKSLNALQLLICNEIAKKLNHQILYEESLSTKCSLRYEGYC